MRAFYHPELGGDLISLEGEQAHHLKNVLRLKVGEELLVLDGNGHRRSYELSEISKKSATLKALAPSAPKAAKSGFVLAIAKLKKDAMDLSFKMATELGFEKILILETEFSQRYPLNTKRAHQLCVSALEQSNAFYLPTVHELSLQSFLTRDYQALYLSLNEDSGAKGIPLLNSVNALLVGPEGGFSLDEHQLILASKKAAALTLPTNILRAPTALSCGFGAFLASKNCLAAMKNL